MGFVFTNFQADNYGTSSGDDEGNTNPIIPTLPRLPCLFGKGANLTGYLSHSAIMSHNVDVFLL